MASADSVNSTATRVRAIARDLGNKNKAKWERIEAALRRLSALADDLDAGVEGVEVADAA